MSTLTFPKGFLWGTASASYQIEGAPREDGKGESIWDRFSHTLGRIKRGDTGDVACDFYHRYKEDIALQAGLGLNASRISLSWPRIMPEGQGTANEKGIDFYSRVIDELLRCGITPFVTLYHWDLPQKLEDLGGWPNRELAKRFSDYAALACDRLGDRVKHWMVFNEPWIFTVLGYLTGIHAPGRREPAAAMRATHVVNLAQGMAARAMRASRNPPAALGTAFSMAPVYPLNDTAEDREAAERWHRFANLWFLETAMEGRYPEVFLDGKTAERLAVEPGDLETVKAPLDFIGINLYSRAFARHDPSDVNMGVRPAQAPADNVTEFGWEIYPKAISEMALRIARAYPKTPLYITENGCSFGDAPGSGGEVRDERRISFMRGYLAEVARAIAAGADIRGYFTWTLTDNFEWAEGLYAQRFGIVYCDFQTQRRTIKNSGKWYAALARSNTLTTVEDE